MYHSFVTSYKLEDCFCIFSIILTMTLKGGSIIFPFMKEGHQGSERLSGLHKATQLANSRADSQPWSVGPHKPTSFPLHLENVLELQCARGPCLGRVGRAVCNALEALYDADWTENTCAPLALRCSTQSSVGHTPRSVTSSVSGREFHGRLSTSIPLSVQLDSRVFIHSFVWHLPDSSHDMARGPQRGGSQGRRLYS